uniref:hypothetical protein n=1 Tax=Trichocoleus desertorum TaxID=1481672 RepID=UPI0025B5E417|nr:hypothetical protein [Trichocoleus desertorum]
MFPLIGVGLLQVATTSAYDPDAQAVISAIEATGVTLSPTQKTACNNRILAHKADQTWAKLIGYYGFLGGTAASHAINWKSPGTYNLTYIGTISHSANGVQASGSGSAANTEYNFASAGLLTRSAHLACYSRTNIAETSCDMGALEYYPAFGSVKAMGLYLRWSTGELIYSGIDQIQFGIAASTGATVAAHTFDSGSNGKAFRVIQSGSAIYTATITGVASLTELNAPLYLMNRSNVNAPDPAAYDRVSSRQFGSFQFGYDFTQSEAIASSNSEQAYQTDLGRQV